MANLTNLRSALIARRGIYGLSRRAANARRWARHNAIRDAVGTAIRARTALARNAKLNPTLNPGDAGYAIRLARDVASARAALRAALRNPPALAEVAKLLRAQHAPR